MILDIFSHYVVGWMLARQESAALAQRIIEETCHKQAIQLNQLTIHADRGFSMTSKPVAFLLADQGVTRLTAGLIKRARSCSTPSKTWRSSC
ncbi:MAG: transposase family protein [Deltaproteobacteria bacterium]|nr:transposase family protein [Deltaproteobacteria bacterium]